MRQIEPLNSSLETVPFTPTISNKVEAVTDSA